MIPIEYWEQTWFGDNVVSIIALEVARCIKICTRTFYHFGDGYDLTTEKSEPFESVASIVNLAIQVMFDKPWFDLPKRYSVDWTNWHYLLSTIEANEDFDTGLFFAVFALEGVINGIDILERREFDYIALSECKGSVGLACLRKFFVADTLHTSKLCIWFRKINVYHNKNKLRVMRNIICLS